MITPELIAYLKNELGRGVNRAELKNTLLGNGWAEIDVEAAFNQIESPSAVRPAPAPTNIPTEPQPATNTTPIVTSQPNSQTTINNPVIAPVTTPTKEHDNRTLVTVLVLIFLYPIGVILMWVWSRWKVWLKILLSLPLVLGVVIFILAIVSGGLIALFNPNSLKVSTDSESGIKSTNGSQCTLDSDCQSDKCVSTTTDRICTEGLAGDPCFMSLDCLSKYCVDNVCTEGKSGDQCFTSFDCQDDLTCVSETCRENPATQP